MVQRRAVEQVREAVKLAVAPFGVAVAVEYAEGFGGWAVRVVPPAAGMAAVEVLVPDQAGRDGIVSAGSGSAFMYSGDDLAGILEDALPVIQAAAVGDLQTAGETLYLLADRRWVIRGGMPWLPRLLRPRRRYTAYPTADPAPTVPDLVRTAVEQVQATVDADHEEIHGDGGWGIQIRPNGTDADSDSDSDVVRVVVRAGQDEEESWSVLTIVDAVGRSWEVHDWGSEGEIATRTLVSLTQITAGRVQLALDDVPTVWVEHGGRWRPLGPQTRRPRRRRPHRTPTAWPLRPT